MVIEMMKAMHWMTEDYLVGLLKPANYEMVDDNCPVR